ncbi:hypothetical protein Vafri_6270 [Volvox africanus]|uniref:Uncharacterized protein n=1 Tax=Volvox africanus TaxID=51714 RepID=A0A8J4B2M1_9CHLO|nr:hypothetical protein Vafri_6270 [Volvox africanus]
MLTVSGRRSRGAASAATLIPRRIPVPVPVPALRRPNLPQLFRYTLAAAFTLSTVSALLLMAPAVSAGGVKPVTARRRLRGELLDSLNGEGGTIPAFAFRQSYMDTLASGLKSIPTFAAAAAAPASGSGPSLTSTATSVPAVAAILKLTPTSTGPVAVQPAAATDNLQMQQSAFRRWIRPFHLATEAPVAVPDPTLDPLPSASASASATSAAATSSAGGAASTSTPLTGGIQNTDPVAMAAARALGLQNGGGGGGGGGGGLNVVSSNPLSISNPIEIEGGNFNKRGNMAGANGLR